MTKHKSESGTTNTSMTLSDNNTKEVSSGTAGVDKRDRPTSFLSMGVNPMIHMGVEVIVISALVYYFNGRVKTLETKIVELTERLDSQDSVILNHQEAINKVIKLVSMSGTTSLHKKSVDNDGRTNHEVSVSPKPKPLPGTLNKQKIQESVNTKKILKPSDMQHTLQKKSVVFNDRVDVTSSNDKSTTRVDLGETQLGETHLGETLSNIDLDKELAQELKELTIHVNRQQTDESEEPSNDKINLNDEIVSNN